MKRQTCLSIKNNYEQKTALQIIIQILGRGAVAAAKLEKLL